MKSFDAISRPALPTEMCEHIITMVTEYGSLPEREVGLSTCSLVSRSWTPKARFHLYNLIHLGSDLRTKKFLNTLSLSPPLGHNVETLQIWPDDKASPHGWIYKILFFLPPRLPHLRGLIFGDLPVVHQIFFAVVSRFTTVVSLEVDFLDMQSFGEIVRLVNRFPQLRRLNLFHSEWRSPTEAQAYTGRQPQLTALFVDNENLECTKDALRWALESHSASLLTTFSTPISSKTCGDISSILRACRSTLREARFTIRNKGINIPQLIDHPVLEHLQISGLRANVIHQLTRFPLFAPKSLRGIRLNLWSDPVEDIEDHDHKAQWIVIDHILCSPQFVRLSSVEISPNQELPIPGLHILFQEMMPKSYKRGMLWHARDGVCTRIAPHGTPYFPGLPLEWDKFQ